MKYEVFASKTYQLMKFEFLVKKTLRVREAVKPCVPGYYKFIPFPSPGTKAITSGKRTPKFQRLFLQSGLHQNLRFQLMELEKTEMVWCADLIFSIPNTLVLEGLFRFLFLPRKAASAYSKHVTSCDHMTCKKGLLHVK